MEEVAAIRSSAVQPITEIMVEEIASSVVVIEAPEVIEVEVVVVVEEVHSSIEGMIEIQEEEMTITEEVAIQVVVMAQKSGQTMEVLG